MEEDKSRSAFLTVESLLSLLSMVCLPSRWREWILYARFRSRCWHYNDVGDGHSCCQWRCQNWFCFWKERYVLLTIILINCVYLSFLIDVGLVPEACSSYILPRIVGISKAMELTLTGRVFLAKEEPLLFSHIVPKGIPCWWYIIY